jgi:NADPH-dependent 7-cyano-7-deazaguanine reductase QueF
MSCTSRLADSEHQWVMHYAQHSEFVEQCVAVEVHQAIKHSVQPETPMQA